MFVFLSQWLYTIARTARLTHMVAEAKEDGPQRSDEAYAQGVAPSGQVG